MEIIDENVIHVCKYYGVMWKENTCVTLLRDIENVGPN